MKIWVDADACPGPIRDILFRVALRVDIPVTLVANQRITTPRSPLIRMLQVEQGFDRADQEIVNRAAAGDLVITSDIPLAAEAIKTGAEVLSPRGERYTPDNIAARLSMRDFMESLRASGEQTGGPSAFSQADRKAFADQRDAAHQAARRLFGGFVHASLDRPTGRPLQAGFGAAPREGLAELDAQPADIDGRVVLDIDPE